MAGRTTKEFRAANAARHPALPRFAGRKSWSGVAAATLLLSLAPLVQGAGLGELRQQSALGEPLNVVINLSDDGKLGLNETNVRLANPDIYEALGIQRNAILDKARISIETKDGATRLRITSPGIVLEPILSLVLELDYGKGVVRRNYGLLMDPPPADTYQHYASAAGEQPERAEPAEQAVQQASRPAVERHARHTARARPRTGAVVAGTPAHPQEASAAGDSYGPVPWGTTLSHIALALRARPGMPLAPLERALYQANPQAFHGGPSRLLAGARLRIPQGELFKHGTTTAESSEAPAAVAALGPTTPAAAAPAISATEQPGNMEVAGPASSVPDGTTHLFRLDERLDLSAVALLAPAGQATQARQRPANSASAVGAATPRPGGVAAPAAAGGAAALERGRQIPWEAFFSFPVWLGILVFGLGLAWVRMRLLGKARPPRSPQVLAGTARESLAAPVSYSPPLALKAPAHEPSGQSVSGNDVGRKLHAAERSEFRMSVDLDSDDVLPAAAEAATPEAGAKAPREVMDPNQYSEAVEFLVSVLALHPERADLRLKLLEIYSAAGNLEGFTEQARQFMTHNKGEKSPHWGEVRRMGLDLDPNWSVLKTQTTPTKVRRFYDGLDQLGMNQALEQLDAAYGKVRGDPAFIAAIAELCGSEAGLPTPYLHAEALSRQVGGAQIYIKRDDLRQRDTDLLVNALGQVMLAKWTGRTSVVAGLEDGPHGEAVAKAAKAMRIPALICVPKALTAEPNHPVVRALGQHNAISLPAVDEDGVAVPDGRRSAMRRWLQAPAEMLFISSLRSSPMPFPAIVRDFQALGGQEIKRQSFRYAGGMPRAVVSNIAAGYATFGMIQSFLDIGDVRIDCVELDTATAPGAAVAAGYTRELDWLRGRGRVNFPVVSRDAVAAAVEMCRQAGEPVPEPNNACVLAQAIAIAKELPAGASVVALFA